MSYSLTLYIYPSPYGIQWKSPHHLAKSAVINTLSGKPRTIGHVSVELTAQGQTKIFTGMSTLHFKRNKKLILWDGLGLGILFYEYPGHLERAEDLIPEKAERLKSGHFSFIQFHLSESSYLKVLQYLTEYQELNVGSRYGLPHRPRHKEGSGCSAFAVSVLEVAGVLEEEHKKNWSGQVRVPEEYCGELSNHSKKPSKKASIFKILWPSARALRWAEPHEPGKNVFFWDPDMMHRWVFRKFNSLSNDLVDARYKKTFISNTAGLVVNATDRVPGDDPIWL